MAAPPARALLIYDGDCSICSLCVRRWQKTTGAHLDYLPFQDPGVARRFPEVPRGQFQTAVQLIEPDGRVYGGAVAVLRALAQGPRRARLLNWYERWPLFARAAEWTYRLVARHRRFFAALTRLAWGAAHRSFDKPGRRASV